MITNPPALSLPSIAESSTAVPSVLPKTTKLAPEASPLGSSKGAPIIKSASPSPFTSPALLTDWPEKSLSETPLITKPPALASLSISDSSALI